jgi:hypothetical protein
MGAGDPSVRLGGGGNENGRAMFLIRLPLMIFVTPGEAIIRTKFSSVAAPLGWWITPSNLTVNETLQTFVLVPE